ncbi:MAG TPA: nucleotide sugar dehydrogenase [Candidatus Eisenbacteria bacterium]|nr:nucleotide sugar dehydrogenase [Candidatus Eisenbacteria bacterium]
MERLSISIFGLGYVGTVSAACLASKGHNVIGVDLNPDKVEMMDSGRSPVIEAQVSELVAAAKNEGSLQASCDASYAVLNSDLSFVCVGTPGLKNGKLDLIHIENVAREIGTAIKVKNSPHVFVLRSTVLPGTTEGIVLPILESESGKQCGRDFAVCYNPEFLREGSAVADFQNPPYTILGARESHHLAPLRRIYQDISSTIYETTIATAEMVKYFSNCYHALKVGFANEMGSMCKRLGVDSETVTKIFTSDTKLNVSPAYLSPGFAFGGSCLPKDLRAIIYKAKELDLKLPLLESLMPSNTEHLDRAVDMVISTGKRKIAQLGLSFKAGTDDLRESPLVMLIKRLMGEGFEVRVWDEDVSLGRLAGSNRKYIEEVIPHIGSVLSGDLQSVMRGAEVVILGNKSADREQLADYLTPDQVVIDLVHLDAELRPRSVAKYEGICW